MNKAFITLMFTWMWLSVEAGNSGKLITLGVSIKFDTSNLLRQDDSSLKKDVDETCNICKANFGFRIGGALSNTNFNQGYPKPSKPVETIWKAGFIGGLILEVTLYRKLYLQQEYAFAILKGTVKDAGAIYNLSYISLPVLLKYKLLPKLAIVAGPQFDILVQARERHDGNMTDITHDIEERNFSAVAGLTYMITKEISIDARFAQGLNHIGLSQGLMAQEFKLQAVQFAVSYTPLR
ncbi:hypothetical protein GCM10023188_36040 [Pontibacter saemangeumensis]|uniref:Outer membrane protein beta-barrel domain-containing protein n=2 Tax=Pontibacter saemangeumensis TaxID=1084525 RepID=A0ABP8M0N0_9BACT